MIFLNLQYIVNFLVSVFSVSQKNRFGGFYRPGKEDPQNFVFFVFSESQKFVFFKGFNKKFELFCWTQELPL